MPTPYIGEVKLVPFNFAPKGWALCNGQLLQIAQNQVLFSLLGTFYGGDGRTTFALPNLQGRTILGTGNGSGLSPYTIGQQPGQQPVVPTVDQIPSHTHLLNVSNATASAASPIGAYPAIAAASVGMPYDPGMSGAMPNAVQANPGGQGHENRQPFLVLNYVIALTGVFPPRD